MPAINEQDSRHPQVRPLPVFVPIRNPISLGLAWLSKSDPRLLSVCSRWAIATQVAFGVFVLFTSMLAFGAAYYTLSTLNVPVALVPWIAAGWSVFVLFLDREIAGSLDKATAVVRPFLALFLGTLTAIPVEMAVFQNRTDQELERQFRQDNKEQLDALHLEQRKLDQRRVDLEATLADLRTQENEWGKILDSEAVGRSGAGRTGVAGAGPVFRNAEVQQAGVRSRIQEARRDLDLLEQSLPARQQRLELQFRREAIAKVTDTNTLDFPNILAEKKVLLVNLARQNVISEDNQHLLGTLLVNELLSAGFARRPHERQPFFVFIDEFSHFVTKDACEILDGGRKFGLHFTLAHQHLAQLKEKDPEVYYSTLTNARTKVVFGGLNDEDVELISKELYTGEFDPEQVKDEIWHRGFEPVETTRTVRGHSSSQSSGESSADVSHSSLASGQVWIPGSDLWSSPTLTSTSRSTARGSSRNRGHQTSASFGETETTVPFYEFHEYRELTSRTFRSLEEQLYLKKAQLKRQPNQHAAVLIPGENVQLLKVATLRELPVTENQTEEFRLSCMEAARCYKTPQQAEVELTALEDQLLLEARNSIVVQSEGSAKIAPITRKSTQKPIWDRTGSKG